MYMYFKIIHPHFRDYIMYLNFNLCTCSAWPSHPSRFKRLLIGSPSEYILCEFAY